MVEYPWSFYTQTEVFENFMLDFMRGFVLKRYYLVLLALLCLALAVTVFASESATVVSEETAIAEEASQSEILYSVPIVNINSGVYTVKNKASGQYINAFDFSFADGGYAYVANRSQSAGEDILFLALDDGSFLLYPQSESGKYAFALGSDVKGERITKSEETGELSEFYLRGDENGYVIATSGGHVLGITEQSQLYKKTLVLTEEYSGEDTQLWTLEPVEVSSLELRTVSERVRKNSVSAVYALVKPAYMKQFIQWTSSDEDILLIDDDGSFCALEEGVVTVTATVGNLSESIEVTVLDKGAFTWYSQHLVSDGGWHGDILKDVYFYAGVHERYIINGFNHNIDWMDQGCYITSVAMVLHNLGARYTDGYDFRFDAEGNLEVDPYVASLSNSRNHGLTTSSGTLYGNPISVNLSAITSNVTLHGQPITANRYGFSKQLLKELLDKHPEGVIVGMHKGKDSHYIVVSECLNPYANPSEYRFQIYDSAGLRRNHADNVPFEKSMSYVTIGYRYASMLSITVFDIAPVEE